MDFVLFVATFVCLVPISFGIGLMIAVVISGLWRRLRRRPDESSVKSSSKMSWPPLLVAACITGFLSFPLTQLASGSSLTIWGTIAVAAALLLFALVTAVLSGSTFTGDTVEGTNKNINAFLSALQPVESWEQAQHCSGSE